MNNGYAARVLRERVRNLQDRLAEIEDGHYSHHVKDRIDKLRNDLVEKEKALNFAIEQLERGDN